MSRRHLRPAASRDDFGGAAGDATARDVVPTRDGPLRVSGNIEICAGTGRTVLRATTARLCRCGHSGDKPFCDGSHARVGFQAEGE